MHRERRVKRRQTETNRESEWKEGDRQTEIEEIRERESEWEEGDRQTEIEEIREREREWEEGDRQTEKGKKETDRRRQTKTDTQRETRSSKTDEVNPSNCFSAPLPGKSCRHFGQASPWQPPSLTC